MTIVDMFISKIVAGLENHWRTVEHNTSYTYDLILTSYDGERWIDEVIGSDKDKTMVRLALQFLSRNNLSQEHYYWIDVSVGN